MTNAIGARHGSCLIQLGEVGGETEPTLGLLDDDAELRPSLKYLLECMLGLNVEVLAESEIQYFHHHATIATTAALNQSPLVDVAATIGTPTITFGAEDRCYVTSGNLTKYTVDLRVSKPDHYASVILGDKGDSIRASYIHYRDVSKKTTAVLEIFRMFSTNENTVTVGGTYAVDHLTLVKGKLNNNGKLGPCCSMR